MRRTSEVVGGGCGRYVLQFSEGEMLQDARLSVFFGTERLYGGTRERGAGGRIAVVVWMFSLLVVMFTLIPRILLQGSMSFQA